MRKAMLLVAVLWFSSSLWAADPLIGTWKLNVEKSKFSPILKDIQPPPKEQTEVYREIEGDLIEFSATSTEQDGSSRSSRWTWPRQGGIAERPANPIPPGILTMVQTWIGPGNWYVTAIRFGKQTAVRHKVISEDGKTMRQTVKGVNPDGKPYEELEVFDRQ